MKANKILVHLPERIYVSVGTLNPRPMEADAQRVLDAEAIFASQRGGLVTKDTFVHGPVKIRKGDIWVIKARPTCMAEALRGALGIPEDAPAGAGFATADDPIHLAEAWTTSLEQGNRPRAVKSAERVIQVTIPMRYNERSGIVAGAVQFTAPISLGQYDAAVVRGVIYPSAFGAPKDAIDTVKAVATAASERRAVAQAQPADNVDEDEVTD